jgi:hypothetical protein
MMLRPAIGRAQQPHPDDFKAQFLHLCDLACTELNRKDYSPFLEAERYVARPKTHHVPFFEDSHAVRALAVAYDMTGNREYLDTCRRWSDRMIAYQDKMIPQGAYYLRISTGRFPPTKVVPCADFRGAQVARGQPDRPRRQAGLGV